MVLREIKITFLLFTSYNSDNVQNIQMDEYALKVFSLSWATREAHNPNLLVAFSHARQVCSQHSSGLPLKMYEIHRPHLITPVLTFSHVKLAHSTELSRVGASAFCYSINIALDYSLLHSQHSITFGYHISNIGRNMGECSCRGHRF